MMLRRQSRIPGGSRAIERGGAPPLFNDALNRLHRAAGRGPDVTSSFPAW
jgi:hypothetical protein